MSPNTLPAHPSLDQIKKQAKELLQAVRDHHADAVALFATHHPSPPQEKHALHDAQLVLARQYGFPSWAKLKQEITAREEKRAVEKFQSVIQKGDADALRHLLSEHPGLRRKLNDPLFEFAAPAIRIAADRRDRNLIDALLEAGADINKRSEWEAGSFGVLDLVDDELGEFLISRGATLDIHSACKLGKLDEAKRFLQADPALVNARGGDGGTPLHFAKNLTIAEFLLAHGADVTIRDLDHNSTAAMWQIHTREIVYRLIEAGSPVDIYMACRHGDIALATRALQEDPACLGSVIGTGSFAFKTGGDIYTYCLIGGGRPLGVASHFQQQPLVDFLLPRATPGDALIYYCMEEDEASARALLAQHPGLLTALTPAQLRCVPDAIWHANNCGFKTYLAVGFPLTGRGTDDCTPLHIAAWLGKTATVQELIRHGADLEDANEAYGGTPLAWACHGNRFCDRDERDYLGVITALLDAGAVATKPANKFGGALLDTVNEGPISDLLKQHGARPK